MSSFIGIAIGVFVGEVLFSGSKLLFQKIKLEKREVKHMSASAKTALGFPQWKKEDKPMMEEFNQAFARMDLIISEQSERIAALEGELQKRQ